MRNLLDALKVEVEQGRLVDRELWLATDNSTAASAYFKGTSSSRSLYEMVSELRELSLKGNFTIHVIQIGIDGLSCTPTHSAAPMHFSPIERYADS
jgi:hypothetical protein